jgi:hypothetical protein
MPVPLTDMIPNMEGFCRGCMPPPFMDKLYLSIEKERNRQERLLAGR